MQMPYYGVPRNAGGRTAPMNISELLAFLNQGQNQGGNMPNIPIPKIPQQGQSSPIQEAAKAYMKMRDTPNMNGWPSEAEQGPGGLLSNMFGKGG